MKESDTKELRRMATVLSRMASRATDDDERFLLTEQSISVTMTADRIENPKPGAASQLFTVMGR